MYQVSRTQVSKKNYPELYAYLLQYCRLSKNLYNAALFRIRNHYTGHSKDILTPNEQSVHDEVLKTVNSCGLKQPGYRLSYKFLEKLMRVTNNPDFFAGLPMQSAQHVVKDACTDFQNWLASMRQYKLTPSAFTGKPQIPHYRKSDVSMVKFTNQDCVLYENGMKFPKTKELLAFPNIGKDCVLKEVQVKPYYNVFLVIVIFENGDKSVNGAKMPNACGIDFGVNNLASIVSNDGLCLLYKGGIVKSQNQWFNKQKARYTSSADKCKQSRDTKMLCSVSKNRDNFMRDYMHKVSSDIIAQCIKHNIGIIVIGKNNGWKQATHIGHKNNQTFVSIPFCTLQWMIRYKAERVGIRVILQEESYTSKASFLDNDIIPIYQKGSDANHTFSGKRVKRGLYKSSNGTLINADLNGAANILRKAMPSAFAPGTDFSFLQNIIVIKNVFRKRIAAA